MTSDSKSELIDGFDAVVYRILLLILIAIVPGIFATSRYFAGSQRAEKVRIIENGLEKFRQTGIKSSSTVQLGGPAINLVKAIVGSDGFAVATSHPDRHLATIRESNLESSHFQGISSGSSPETDIFVYWKNPAFTSLADSYVAPAFVYLFLILATAVAVAISVRRTRILPLCQRLADLEQDSVIARTTQMLVHDVRGMLALSRRIFRELKVSGRENGILPVLNAASDELDAVADRLNNTIADSLAFGSNSAAGAIEVSLDAILEQAIYDAFRQTNDLCEIQIRYSLRHGHKALVNPSALSRVFANILNNGIQAMGSSGTIHVSSRELHVGDRLMVELAIANSGPQIPLELRERVFSAFYTSGKRDGTGLGLAIARKIVNDHGGKIRCGKTSDGMVEFALTIPATANSLNKPVPHLPNSAADARSNSFKVLAGPGRTSLAGINPYDLLAERAGDLDLPVQVLFIDEEPYYTQCLEKHFAAVAKFGLPVETTTVRSEMEALDAARRVGFDIVISEFHLPSSTGDGFVLIDGLRRILTPETVYCILTGMDVLEMALRKRVNVVIRKPVDELHVVKILASWLLARRTIRKGAEESAKPNLEIAVVDDSVYDLEAWQRQLPEIKVHVFLSPGDFLDALSREKIDLHRLSAIVLDYYYGSASPINGLQFAAKLRDIPALFTIPILIATEAPIESDPGSGIVVISKSPPRLPELMKYLRGNKLSKMN